MIRLFIILSIFAGISKANAQYFFRGQTMDEKGKPLPYINIKIQSSGLTFKSDYDGSFGIPSKKASDSLIFSFDGYETTTVLAVNKQSIKVTVKKIPVKKRDPRNELYSYIQNVHKDFKFWTYNNETYTSLVENPFVRSSTYPLSSFSVNTNRASYSNIRRFLNDDEMVPPDAVRIEEMLNYFKFYYNNPDSGETFKAKSVLTQCPWNEENKLLFINLSARTVDMDKVPPCNLVFLIDISGSMDVPRKLPLLKSGLKLLLKNLRPEDTVSLVTYGGRVKTELEGMSGNEKEKLIKAIDSLSPGGDTPGEAAIRTAYRIVRKRLNKGGNNRIILATDGDFNVGTTSEKDLANLIESQKNAGIYLTCIGVGMGNYKDSKLSVLAHTGNGNFAYIDNEVEAEKVFFTEFTQTMYAVADGVFISTEMDPAQVKEYRLIGYDNKRTNMKDTSNRIRGGEIGSGQTTTAIYELVTGNLTGKPVAKATIHYRFPGEENNQEPIRVDCADTETAFKDIHPELKKAACVTQFGLKLKLSEYLPKKTNWARTEKFAESHLSKDIPAEKELLSLITKSRKIYRKKLFGWL